MYPQRLPLLEHVFIPISLLLLFVVFLYSGLTASIQKVIILILSYQVILSLVLNAYFFLVVDQPFGYDPMDALAYLRLADYALNHTLNTLIAYLKSRNTEIADYGFPFVRFFLFNLAGNVERGIIFMVIANAFAMTIGSWYLYKLSLFFMDDKNSKIVTLFWGLNICSIVVNVIGAKESIFTTILIITMYQLYYYFYKKKDLFHLLVMIIFIGFTVFFRIYLTMFFIIIILFKPLYSKRAKKIALLSVILLTIITAYAGYFITSENPILALLLLKEKNQSTNFILINMITGFLGPYPNFLQTAGLNQTAFFWAPYSGFKAFFSIFGLYGGWYILKNHITKLYPLLFYTFFNILLVVGTVRSFDWRFSYTMIPFFFILIMYGFERFRVKYKTIVSSLYFCVIFVLIYSYNLR
jgi:hypothetical protein